MADIFDRIAGATLNSAPAKPKGDIFDTVAADPNFLADGVTPAVIKGYQGPEPATPAPQPEQVKPRQYKGFWDEFYRSLKRGRYQFESGLGTTVEKILPHIAGTAANAQEQLKRPDLQPAQNGGKAAFVAQSVGTALPYMAGTVTAGAIGGPLAAFGVGAGAMGGDAYNEAIEQGASEEAALVEAGIVGTINGAIEMAQVGQVLKFAKKPAQAVFQAAKQKAWQRILKAGGKLSADIVKTAALEGTEEALQEITSIAVPLVARGQKTPIGEAAERVGMSFLGGAVAGPILGGAGRVANSIPRGKGTQAETAGTADSTPDIANATPNIASQPAPRNPFPAPPKQEFSDQPYKPAPTPAQLQARHNQLYQQMRASKDPAEQAAISQEIAQVRSALSEITGTDYPAEPPAFIIRRQMEAGGKPDPAMVRLATFGQQKTPAQPAPAPMLQKINIDKFVADFPDVANRVAGKRTPSRADVAVLGQRLSEAQRQELARQLRQRPEYAKHATQFGEQVANESVDAFNSLKSGGISENATNEPQKTQRNTEAARASLPEGELSTASPSLSPQAKHLLSQLQLRYGQPVETVVPTNKRAAAELVESGLAKYEKGGRVKLDRAKQQESAKVPVQDNIDGLTVVDLRGYAKELGIPATGGLSKPALANKVRTEIKKQAITAEAAGTKPAVPPAPSKPMELPPNAPADRMPIPSDGPRVKSESTTLERLKKELEGHADIDPTYNRMSLAEDAANAIDFVAKSPDEARRVVVGYNAPPAGITDTAIRLAYAEKMRIDGNWNEAAAAANSIKLTNIRKGQEVAANRGGVNDHSTQAFVSQVIDARMGKLARQKRFGKSETAATQVTEKIDSQAKLAQKKLSTKKMDIAEAQKVLDGLIC
jgi:hypothetical protein